MSAPDKMPKIERPKTLGPDKAPMPAGLVEMEAEIKARK